MQMKLSRDKIETSFYAWLNAWNCHNLDGVLHFIHNDIIFTSWDGKVIKGKEALEKIWGIWFANHGDFNFKLEDLFIDETLQKLTFSWELDWPSQEKKFFGMRESRKGVDLLTLKDGKILIKETYSKTLIKINSKQYLMNTV